LKYPEKQFELYDKNCFSTITWQDLFAGRRVLVCSITRQPQVFVQDYIKELTALEEVYKTAGVDQVYLMASPGLGFINLCNRPTTLGRLADVNREFNTYLNKLVNTNDRDSAFLGRFWNYQVLITDGQVEQITQQPLDNYVATMLKDTKQYQLLKDLGIKNDNMIWTPTFLSRTINAARDIYYYRLCPNTALRQHLFPNGVDK
jgi:peroxiredoxin